VTKRKTAVESVDSTVRDFQADAVIEWAGADPAQVNPEVRDLMGRALQTNDGDVSRAVETVTMLEHCKRLGIDPVTATPEQLAEARLGVNEELAGLEAQAVIYTRHGLDPMTITREEMEQVQMDEHEHWLIEAARNTARLKMDPEWNTRSPRDVELHLETRLALDEGLARGFTADELVAATVVERNMASAVRKTRRKEPARSRSLRRTNTFASTMAR
jgi:hypothetical protein